MASDWLPGIGTPTRVSSLRSTPPAPADPLLAHPNLIATPHIGFVTEDEFDSQFTDIFEQVNAYAAGAPIHMVNPSVYGR